MIAASALIGAPGSAVQTSAQSIRTAQRAILREVNPQQVKHAPAGSDLRAQTERNSAVALQLDRGNAQPLSMASGDFDGDGFEDLIVGYDTPAGGAVALQHGNADAFASLSEVAFQAIARGDIPAAFLPDAQVAQVPIRPDFIAAGDLTGNGRLDLAVASRSHAALYVLAGDGKGGFAQAQLVVLPGAVTALAAGAGGLGVRAPSLVVGTTDQPGGRFALSVFGIAGHGLSTTEIFPLGGPVTHAVFADLGDADTVAALLVGGRVALLRTALPQVEELDLPVVAHALAVGSFVFDRKPGQQLAVLAADGSIQIIARSDLDPRAFGLEELRNLRTAGRRGYGAQRTAISAERSRAWKIVETIPSVTSFVPEQLPQFVRTRVSDHAADDLLVLSALTHQLAVVSHADVPVGARTLTPAQVASQPFAAAPVAVLATRVNFDGRLGAIVLDADQVAPALLAPQVNPTIFPNRPDDPTPTSPISNACNNTSNGDTSSSCSLREAVLKANSVAGTDTIMLAASTYTLSLARVNGNYSGLHGALYVMDSVNIVGAGQNSTIIQGGTTNANGVDMVMAVNEDISPTSNATASLSSLTVRYGKNRGSVSGFDGDGGCMEFDTGTSGTANLTLTNVTLTDCSTTDGNGAGIAIFNFLAPSTGLATITNSLIQNNSANEVLAAGSGGGIWVADLARMSMSNTQVINNNANQVSNACCRGVGAGVFIFSAGSGSRQSVIHASTITGNHASGDGGGIWDTSNLLVDQAALVSGNTAGGNGGGIYYDAASPDIATFSKITITGNTATGNGGGIAAGEPSLAHAFTIGSSRLAGNTAANGSNLYNIHTTVTAAGAAGPNWWGTNSPAATIANVSGGVTTFDPFVALAHTANAAKIRINQSSTLTGDMSKDNHGTVITLSNLDRLVGLPITFDSPVLGTIPQAQPESLSAAIQATATYNAGAFGGQGSANATVDQAVVTANIVVLQPPSIAESFSPTTVATNTASTLTFSITNGNVVTINASFTDSLPSNLVVAATPSVNNGCGGTVTATAGASSITYSNASSHPVGACTIKVNVSSAVDGVKNNSVTINSTDAGDGNASPASLTVIDPPSIGKLFGAPTIPLNGTTSLTFTLTSTNANSTLNGVAFTDTLPAGLVVATPGGLSNTCGGTASATDGSSSVSLSSASLGPGAVCTLSVTVKGTTAGVQNNSVTVGSTNAGTGNTSNASVTVVAPPTIGKAFGAASIALAGTTSLTFTLNNPNTTVGVTGVGFSDTLPSGLVIATPNGLTGTCGGVIAATQATNVISWSGGSLAQSASCMFSVNVAGTGAGSKNNVTGSITSTEGGTGTFATASLTVNQSVSNTTLTTACPTTFVGNQSFKMTATVTGYNATGASTFQDGALAITGCTSLALSAGAVSCSTAALATGVRSLTAAYGGDANNLPSSSAALPVTVLDPADVIARNGFEAAVAGCPTK